MRAAWLSAIVCAAAACGPKAAPLPPADMPLPPSRDEVEGEQAPAQAPAGDGNLHVLGLTPASGTEAGGEAIRIRGANFRVAKTVTVKFGQAFADVLRITDDEIDVQAPPGSGVVDVVVLFDPGGELKLAAAYTYAAAAKAP
jgi:hypothetical protein